MIGDTIAAVQDDGPLVGDRQGDRRTESAIGETLKEARKSKQLTLSELAESIGVTAGYLSKVERGLIEPSLPMLRVLTDALDLSASAIFLPTAASDKVWVVKKKERPLARFGNLPAPAEMLTPYTWRGRLQPEIEALQMRVPAGSNLCSEDISFEHDEFIYMLGGELEYSYGEEVAIVKKGSGIFIPRRTGHNIRNAGRREAEIVWIARTGNPFESEPESPEDSRHEKTLTSLPQLRLLGERIRRLRTERGMSVAKFAEKIGMTAAYVSKVERNLLEPSLPVLRKIATYFEIEIVYLFADVFPADVLISSGEDRESRKLSIPGMKLGYAAMTPSYLSSGARPELFMIDADLPPGETDSDEYVIHDHAEFALVLEGTIEYITDEGTYRCTKGDSIYLSRKIPHILHNPGRNPCRLLGALGSIGKRFSQTVE
jgi:transcriptional regulator with XRE-family HTH domain